MRHLMKSQVQSKKTTGKEPRPRIPSFILRLWHAVFSTAKDYVVIVRGGSEGKGLKTLQRLLHSGPLVWLGLMILILNIVATAYIGFKSESLPALSAELWEGERVTVPSLALYVSLGVTACGWAYLLVGAAASGLGAYVLVTAYAAFYSLMVGLALGHALWMAVIPLWMLFMGAWVASSHRGRWRIPLLVLLCYMIALLTFPAFGLKHIIPAPWGQIVLAALYLTLIANPWALRERRFRPGGAFVLSTLLFIGFYILVLVRTPASETFGNAFLSFHNLLGLVGLFWYWVGLDLFSSAQDLVEWLVESIKRVLPLRVLRGIIFPIWLLWGIGGYVLIHGLPLPLVRGLVSFREGVTLLQRIAALNLSITFLSALEYHLYATGVIILLAAILWTFHKLSSERLVTLSSIWIFALLVLLGYFGLFYAFMAEDAVEALGFWPLLIFVAGMFWEVLKVSSGLLSGARHRAFIFLGFLLLFGGISILELSAHYPIFSQELSVNAFDGILYLGIPYLLYTFFYRQKRFTPVSPRAIILLFLLGMLSAIPCLILGKVFFVPVLWLGAVFIVTWTRERWDDLWDGIVYGLATGLGFLVFYTRPILIPLPNLMAFMGVFLQAQTRYLQHVITPWEARWWGMLLQVVAAAVILGYALAQARRRQKHLRFTLFILGATLSVLLLAVGEFIFGAL
jgi:hypothetical protein